MLSAKVKTIVYRIQTAKSGFENVIVCVLEHCGIAGNENADQLTRTGTGSLRFSVLIYGS